MTTLILVQRDTTQQTKRGFKLTLEIGALTHDAAGYRFFPFTTVHKPSRKSHKNAAREAQSFWFLEVVNQKGL